MTDLVPKHQVSVVAVEGWFAECTCGWTGEQHPYLARQRAISACTDHLWSVVWPQSEEPVEESVAERIDALQASFPESRMRDLLAQVMLDPYLAASDRAGWRSQVSQLLAEAHG